MNMNSASHGILTGLKKGDASARHCFFCLWNTGLFDKLMWATKGCLIGILLVVHCNPHKTWAVSPPIYPQKPCFFHCSCWTWWFSETFKPRSSRNPLGRSRLDRQTHGNKIPFKMWLAKICWKHLSFVAMIGCTSLHFGFRSWKYECKNAAKKKHIGMICLLLLACFGFQRLGDLKITKKGGGLKKGTLHKTSPYLGLYPFRVTVANEWIQY